MLPADCGQRRDDAADEFNEHEYRSDGAEIVNSLSYGLATLRKLLFTRINDDVGKHVGRDSMMMPVSLKESEEKTQIEIEIFQVAESTVEARRQQFVGDFEWYADWMGKLRLGELATQGPFRKRLVSYLAMSTEQRRLGFSRVLETTFPLATRAPLVLYRLFPLAVGIVTDVAYGKRGRAGELREQQTSWLPSISDCQECRGQPLENGDQCPVCGNPVWSYDWLTAAD